MYNNQTFGGSRKQRFDEFFSSLKLETKVRGVGWHIIDWWWASIESQLTELCSCEFRKVIFISTNVSVSRTGSGKASSTSGGRSLQFLVVVVTQHHVGQLVDLFEKNHVSLDKTHCYFTRLNLKKMGPLQFCLPQK